MTQLSLSAGATRKNLFYIIPEFFKKAFILYPLSSGYRVEESTF